MQSRSRAFKFIAGAFNYGGMFILLLSVITISAVIIEEGSGLSLRAKFKTLLTPSVSNGVKRGH